MDNIQFDRLTRRLVLLGLAGSPFAAGRPGETAARKLRKARRCRRKKRQPCGKRCCPKGQRCENGTCFKPCEDPFTCSGGASGDDACAASVLNCFCTASPVDAAFCAHFPIDNFCSEYADCDASRDCPNGQIRGICSCPMTNASYRCFSLYSPP